MKDILVIQELTQKNFDLMQLARACDGLTGSEIEGAFIEALYAAFDEEKRTNRPETPRVGNGGTGE